ncbi:MAG TPA: hypothetical protein VGQ76_20400 [Thermoanaerobaculia bacterium]|jgi:hypothetical protein|nr:hypothetical protein [Thermoanaerobaculia bacterium]
MKRAIAVLSMVLLAGCFEVDQSINLNKDLSGTADFHIGVDFEPMIIVLAQLGRSLEGKTGPMTAAELEKAKADFKKSEKKSESREPSRAEMEKSLPEGIKLLNYAVKEREFGMDSDFKFGFDKLSQLVGVKLPSKEGGDPTEKNVVDSPFEGLEFSEKGNTITIRAKPQNPTESVKKEAADAPALDNATEKIVADAFAKMRVSYRITAPFTVVSHNATRREGNTLIWEYDMESFEKLEKAKKLDDAGIRVTYRR